MINLIIPPIIILVVLTVLIILLARTMRAAQDEALEQHAQAGLKKDNKKKSRFTRGMAKRYARTTTSLKKMAQKRRINAAVEEARLERTDSESSPEEAVLHNGLSETEQSQRMSRMGEIILSYHRGSETEHIAHDTREASLIQTVEQNPQSVEGYERLGDYYMEQQKFEDARECYKYVLRLNPRHRRAQEAMKNLDRILG